MKKKILLFLITFLFVPFLLVVNAETKCDKNKIEVKSISVVEKTDNVVEKSAASVSGNKLVLNLQMGELNDHIVYDVVVKNNSSEDATFDASNLNVGSKHILYGVSYNDNGTDVSPVVPANSERTLRFTVKYVSEVGDSEYSGGVYNENKNTSDGNVVNPKTGDSSRLFIFIMFVIGFGLIFLIINKRKYSKFFVLLLAVMLLPLAVKAACSCQFELSSHVEILKKETHERMLSLGNSGSTTFFNNSPITKDKVEYIEFIDMSAASNHRLNVASQSPAFPSTYWDVSLDKDDTVRAYYEDNDEDGLYEIAIVANGKIILPDNSSYLFAHFTKVEVITGFDNVDSSRVTNMNSMFLGDAKLTGLLLQGLDTTKVTNMSSMFEGCTELTTILVDTGFSTARATASSNMFKNDTKLVGGKGTTYNASYIDKTYARVDEGSTVPGYFTGMNTPADPEPTTPVTPDEPEEPVVTTTGGTLAQGGSGNTTFFNNSLVNKPDVEKFIIETNMNNVPTDSTKWWDASKAKDNSVKAYYKDTNNNNLYEVYIATNGKLVAPENSSYLFAYYENLTAIEGLQNLDTSNATRLDKMFTGDVKLTALNLRFYNTSKVTNMANMFYNCEKITALDLSSFDTSKVTNMANMFYGCSELTKIVVNGSGFVTTNVTSSGSMFYTCSKLVGGSGTTFDVAHVDKAYARIDGGTSNPGYFTANVETQE